MITGNFIYKFFINHKIVDIESASFKCKTFNSIYHQIALLRNIENTYNIINYELSHLNNKTAIVFGDNHSPCYAWSNSYNKGSRTISRKDGQKLCQWKVDKVISFHTSNKREDDEHMAGYADWFQPEETEYIHGWLQYLN